MYNAGPTALGAFLKRSEQGVSTDLDRLFNHRFTWARQADREKINRCY